MPDLSADHIHIDDDPPLGDVHDVLLQDDAYGGRDEHHHAPAQDYQHAAALPQDHAHDQPGGLPGYPVPCADVPRIDKLGRAVWV